MRATLCQKGVILNSKGAKMDEQELDFALSKKPKEKLLICTNINTDFCGELIKIAENNAEVVFSTTDAMLSDENKSIHTGFVFNSAAFVALCAINKKNSIIISSETKFLAPIELGHEVLFKATALQSGFKKCEVKVEGFLLDIKVFEGMFHIAVFDKKLFKLKTKDESGNK